MVFRFFFPTPTPKQKLEAIAFPLEQLPEVFKTAVNAQPDSTIDQKLSSMLDQYITLQTQLYHLQTNDNENPRSDLKQDEEILDTIYRIVIDANFYTINKTVRGSASVLITLNNDTNSIFDLTDLLTAWDRFPALHYCNPTTGEPITHIDSRLSGGFDMLLNRCHIKPLVILPRQILSRPSSASINAADASTDDTEKPASALFNPN